MRDWGILGTKSKKERPHAGVEDFGNKSEEEEEVLWGIGKAWEQKRRKKNAMRDWIGLDLDLDLGLGY